MNALERFLTHKFISKLTGRTDLHLVIANIGWQTFDQFYRMGVGLLLGFQVTRHLGPEQNGIFYFLIALTLLVTPFSNIGIDAMLNKEFAKTDTNKGVVFGTSVVIKLVFTSLTYLALLMGVWLLPKSSHPLVWYTAIVAVTLFSNGIFQIFDAYFQAITKSKYVVYAKSLVFTIFVFAKLAAIYYRQRLEVFLLLFSIESIFNLGCVYIFYSLSNKKTEKWTFDFSTGLTFGKEGLVWMFQALLLNLQGYIDQVFYAQWVSYEALGIYNVSFRFTTVFVFLPVAIGGSLMTTLVQAKEHSDVRFHQKMINLYRTMFFLFITIALGVLLIHGPMIDFFLGASFAESKGYVLYLVIRLFFVNMGVARGLYFLIENQNTYSTLSTLIGTVVLLVLDVILIPAYGLMGGIFSSHIAMCIQIFVCDSMYKNARINLGLMLRGMKFWQKLNQ